MDTSKQVWYLAVSVAILGYTVVCNHIVSPPPFPPMPEVELSKAAEAAEKASIEIARETPMIIGGTDANGKYKGPSCSSLTRI